MEEYKLNINQQEYTITGDESIPLLWALRDLIKLKGTKYGCGIGMCGACTVHLDGNAVRSCMTKTSACVNHNVTTIEGLGNEKLHALQEAWISLQVPQCGYCQSGQLMSAASLLSKNPDPTDEEIIAAMKGNLCRCGTYDRIKKAIRLASKNLKA